MYTIYPLECQLLCGVRVVRARPWRSAVRSDDTENRTIGTCDHDEGTSDDDKDGPANLEPPLVVALTRASSGVVIEPHQSHGLEGHEGSQQRSNEGDETIEHWDTTANQVRDDGNT